MRAGLTAMAATLAIPLTNETGWQNLTYRHIRPNSVSFGSDGLKMEVRSSASPLVRAIHPPVRVKGFEIDLSLEGALRFQAGKLPDDAYLRVGLVVAGPRRLNWFERQMAPDWLLKLMALAPGGEGVDRVYFFNVVDLPVKQGSERVLPRSKELIHETNFALRSGRSRLKTFYQLPTALSVVAVWLGGDGDDSRSDFTVVLHSLTLTLE